MTARLPTQLTTFTGAPLPLPAMPQDRLLTVNIEEIPLLKDLLGVPGIHLKPLRLDPERNEWVFMAVCAPGCSLPLHYHTGPAQVYTLQGRWCYREYPEQPQVAGSYLYEPAGSVHTFYCPEDNTEDTIVIAWLEGAQVCFNDDGGFIGINDSVLVQHLTETVAAQRGLAPVRYIRGNGADVDRSLMHASTGSMDTHPNQGGPLAGLRIVDITEVVMGPSATQMLADLGADVIKVEPPGGDMLRATGPGGLSGAGPLFLNLNRNKRSIVLDLKKPAGKEALLKLAGTADALVYNVRPQAMQRLGLDYEAVRAVNPRIVYVGTFGFSQRGRYADSRAFDDLIQAAVAIPEASLRAGSEVPRYAPLNLADRATGLYAFGVICAALLARERTGRGQAVDVPMFETTAHMMLGDHLYGHTFVPPRGGFGYPRLLNPQRRPYATQDGLVCLVVYTEAQWKAFMQAVGESERFERDPRFANGESRTQHVEALYAILADKLTAKTTQQWRELLEPLGIPVLPAHTFESLLQDPHLRDIGFFQQVEHPTEGTLRTMAVPSEWPQSPLPPLRPPPRLGEHSEEVLAEAGYSPAEIEALVESGASHGTARRRQEELQA